MKTAGAKVLVIDAGGRGNALAHAFARSPAVEKVYVAPGNAGSSLMDKCRQAAAEGESPKSKEDLINFAIKENIDLVFVGQERYLSEGIVNLFQEKGLMIVGPVKEAAMLEGSKCYAKDFLRSIGAPIPQYKNFSDSFEAKEYARQYFSDNPGKGLVIKADGIAAGKGSIACSSLDESLSAIERIMVSPRLFGNAGSQIDIEEKLVGQELMFFAITDGRNILPMESAMDYKQAFAADEVAAIRLFNRLSGNPTPDNNPNTGGMGGFSPHPWLDSELTESIMKRIAVPTINGFREKTGISYTGIIYFGLMISEDKTPYVLEINVRFGDPEAQVILPRLRTDMYELSKAVLDRNLGSIQLKWSSDHCLGICATSGYIANPFSSRKSKERPGYPSSHCTNMLISGLENVDSGVLVYHNGTVSGKYDQTKDKLFSAGGRVLTIVGRGKNLGEARTKAYENIKRIGFNGMRYRNDIGTGYT